MNITIVEDIFVEKTESDINVNKFKVKKETVTYRGKKIKEIYWKLFNKGETFNFDKPINIIVGKNGLGKSTLFNLVNDDSNKIEKVIEGGFYYIEVQKQDFKNKTKQLYSNAGLGGFSTINEGIANLMYQNYKSMDNSHGEDFLPFWEVFFKHFETCEKSTIVIDEPEIGLDVFNKKHIIKKLKKTIRKT